MLFRGCEHFAGAGVEVDLRDGLSEDIDEDLDEGVNECEDECAHEGETVVVDVVVCEDLGGDVVVDEDMD